MDLPAVGVISAKLHTFSLIRKNLRVPCYSRNISQRQTDMKMISAYSSLSHMGMMALGIFSLTTAGILGATFLMVAHGLIVGGLFIILGILEDKSTTREIKILGGLNEDAPRLGAYFLFFALAALGLPGRR